MAFGKVKVAPTRIPDRSWVTASPAVYEKATAGLTPQERFVVELSDRDLKNYVAYKRMHDKKYWAEQTFLGTMAVASGATIINLWAVPIFLHYVDVVREKTDAKYTKIIGAQREALRNKVLVNVELEKFNSFTI